MRLTRHPLDLFSLLSGLLVTTIAVTALVDGWTRPVADWVWPTVLVALGVLVLGATLLRGRGDGTAPDVPAEPDPWDEDAVADELRDDIAPDPVWARDAGPDDA